MNRTSRFSSTARRVALPATAIALALGTATALMAQQSTGAEDEVPTAQSAHGPPLVLQAQGSFFIDGHTVHSDALTGTGSGLLGSSNQGDITVDQMYVRYMIPMHAGRRVPVVL